MSTYDRFQYILLFILSILLLISALFRHPYTDKFQSEIYGMVTLILAWQLLHACDHILMLSRIKK